MTNSSSYDLLLERRSIRKYQDRKIAPEQIKMLLKAAMQAPSAVNRQPWHFLVIDDPEIFQEIMAIHPFASFLGGASHAILVCGDEEEQHDAGYYVVDCGAATQNILLAAQSIGIGSCWIGVHPREERIRNFKKLFELPSRIQPFSLVSLGYPAEEKGKADRYREDKIHYNTWKEKL